MRELRIHDWCDRCHHEDGLMVPAVDSFIVSIISTSTRPGKDDGARRIDACEPHAEPMRVARDMVLRIGTIPVGEDQPAPARGRPAVPRQSLAQPELPVAEPARLPAKVAWEAQRITCPVKGCGVEFKRASVYEHLISKRHGAVRKPQPKRCPDCNARYDGSQAMTAHRQRRHGFDAVAELVKSVKQ